MKESATSPPSARQKPKQSRRGQTAKVALYGLLALALFAAIPLLARPSFHHSSGGTSRPSGLLLVNGASDDYNRTTWIQSMEPWEVKGPVSMGITTQFQVPTVKDDAGNVVKPPASEADGIDISYLLVDSLATGLTGCSEHVDGAIEDDLIGFDDLSAEEREVVVSWMGNQSATPDHADTKGAAAERAHAARKLDFRRLTPINPNPAVSEYDPETHLSVVRFETICSFSPEAFWHEVGNAEAFAFPYVYSLFKSSEWPTSSQWTFRSLRFKHSINGQYKLVDSTVRPEFRDEGFVRFGATSEAKLGNYAILSPLEVAYTDVQQEKFERAMLLVAGILAGLLSSIILKGVEACIKKVSEGLVGPTD